MTTLTWYICMFRIILVCNCHGLLMQVDPSGYLLYCPCMGRFGNQADHFLGALGFAKGINRTLVLPPWVEYRYGEPKSLQIPFNTYFKVEPLLAVHRVITMEHFMKELAPDIWPPEKRIAFCYTARGENGQCNAKEGNPFGPFWDTFSVDFVGSEFYSPLHYDVHHSDMPTKWNEKYPPSVWPGWPFAIVSAINPNNNRYNEDPSTIKFKVLAFTGAPASFPVQKENRELQQNLHWSEAIDKQAHDYIKHHLSQGAFIGIHLRNGIDWVRACEHIRDSPSLFSASQCLGYRNELGKATMEMCMPTKDIIIKQIKRLTRSAGNVVAIFVASDSKHMITELSDAFHRAEISVHKAENTTPHLDLAILGRANYFVGNCISSFTAFVKRERDARGFPSAFWAFPPFRTTTSNHEEL